MNTVNINDIVKGQRTDKGQKATGNTLFVGDSERVDTLGEYASISFISSETTDYGLQETVIAINNENMPYLVNANTTSFNGESQTSFMIKELSLNGFSYFATMVQDDDIENLTVCNDYFLQVNGLDVSFNDIIDLFELNADYNVYMLSFETDTAKYTITARNGLLKKITKRDVGQNVKLKSAFGK